MTNRLAESLSPYLRQHAENPVDWFEWGDAAFAEARRRDVPILLSVGYAACHWCHVMAHESFEDAQVAAAMNDGFVAVKVDREERPDVDAVHMAVTQALTGHGGWPMTVFLTPAGAPLYAGTYFPREQFLGVLESIAQIWRDDRARAVEAGQSIVTAMASMGAEQGPGSLGDVDLGRAVAALRRQYDDARGGFGGAPKFPPSMTVEHLLRHHARTGDADALAMAAGTCDAMARGGMYDQLDGGFARYSVDASWVVPHFEKMLYDNAQLLRAYTHLWRATGDPLPRRVAHETADFMLRRLRTDEGAFASALDADTDGVEGLTYAWTPQQLLDVLGGADGEWAARLLAVTPEGTFEHGTSTLQLRRDPSEVLAGEELGGVAPVAWWADVRRRLLAARDERPQPARDDKVVTAWNGLAIAALAEAAMIFDEPQWLDAARGAAAFVVDRHLVDGRLRRTSLGGRVSDALACADDYGNLAEALLVLHQADGDAAHLALARRLLDDAARLFVTEEGVFDTGSDAEQLFVRPRPQGDNAEPCGASALASAFVMAFALTGEPELHALAQRCLAPLTPVMAGNPRFAGWALATAEALADGPVQVAVVVPECAGPSEDDHAGEGIAVEAVPDESGRAGDESGEAWKAGPWGGDAESAAMLRRAWRSTRPGLVRVAGVAGVDGVPLLADRPVVDGTATAYVCRGFVCDAPVTSAAAMDI